MICQGPMAPLLKRASHVSGPTMPSTARSLLPWKWRTASSVLGPKLASSVPTSAYPNSNNCCCKLFTSSPRIVGLARRSVRSKVGFVGVGVMVGLGVDVGWTIWIRYSSISMACKVLSPAFATHKRWPSKVRATGWLPVGRVGPTLPVAMSIP